MKKFIFGFLNFIKENIVGICIFGILVACLICSITALSISQTNSLFIDSVSQLLNTLISNS